MKELKTLKDLRFFDEYKNQIGEEYNIMIRDELKAKAVKWVKRLREEDNYDKHGYSDVISLEDFKKTDDYENGLGISWAECSDIPATINFIKHFFNLTEEDLK